ncbi:MAG: flippase-like domain-containing protein [Acidobacteriota bacterium]|nr:flippase-like domain-containing protein [Acidobacteriota bacterium]
MNPAARALRLLIAAGLFALLLWYSDPGAVGRALAGVRWPWIGAAVLLVLLDRALMAWRWIALLAPVTDGTRPPLASLFRIFFVSTFLGTFLPASVGGDAVRAWSLARTGVPSHQSFASVLMDRLLGVIGIVFAAAAGLLLAPEMLGERVVWIGLLITVGACLAGLAFIFSPQAAALFLRAIHGAGASRLHRPFDRLFGALQAYRGHRGTLLGVLSASTAVQALRILQAWLLGLSLGIAAPAGAYFAFVPLILLVMLLPITVNGIGTSQATFVWAFARAGVPADNAFALSVLFVALGIVGNIPGAFLYALSGTPGQRAPQQ